MSRIDLIAKRREDLDGGRPDYAVYAGEQLVGRIYQSHNDGWLWSINTVLTDARIGGVLQGYASDLPTAKSHLRAGFDAWLAWALRVPASDPKFPALDRQLRAIGIRRGDSAG